MKLLLIRCSVCSSWRSPAHAHCHVCGARLNNGKIVNQKGIELKRALCSDLAYSVLVQRGN